MAELEISIGRIVIQDGALVLSNLETDALQTRTILGPQDVRGILAQFMRPRILWHAITCFFRKNPPPETTQEKAEHHATPNPW
jgi:hypothetical protein